MGPRSPLQTFLPPHLQPSHRPSVKRLLGRLSQPYPVIVTVSAYIDEWTFPIVLLLASLLAVPPAHATHTAADTTHAPEKYWILLNNRPTVDATGPKAWTQPVAPSFLSSLCNNGINPVVKSRWLHAVSARLTQAQRQWVQARSFVRGVRPVAIGHVTSPPTSPKPIWNSLSTTPPSPDSLSFGPSRGPLARINAVTPMKRGLDGRGVQIGFLDAHYQGLRHPAFAPLRRDNRIIALRNFAEGRQSGNHGMGVASVTVGNAPGTLLGPAHGAEVLAASTEYTPFERNVEEDYFVAGLEWLHRRGADVVNVSIGYNTFDEGQDDYTTEDLDGDTGLTTKAVDRAAQLGVTVVVSAGNSGCASPDSCWYYVNTPADADSAITVGGVNPDSTLASFSSRGPTADGRYKPDVVVQGNNVLAAWKNDKYARLGGTSFASPQVTGVVAQMLQVNPDLSPIQIRTLLRQTASQAENPDNRMGWGVVDADAAIRAAERKARANPPATLLVESPYLNASSTRLTIPVRVPSTSPLHISLYTPLGRTVFSKTIPVRPGPNWLTIPTEALPSGLYGYRLQTAQQIATGTVSW